MCLLRTQRALISDLLYVLERIRISLSTYRKKAQRLQRYIDLIVNLETANRKAPSLSLKHGMHPSFSPAGLARCS